MSQIIHILTGSTRNARIGDAITSWVKDQIANNFDAEVKVIDLNQEQLPFLANATPPSGAPDDTSHGKAWAEKIKGVERLIIVSPEYNRGVPAALKNALDYLWKEWHGMPVSVVSYGYLDGGASAAKHLGDTLTWLKTSQTDNVTLPLAGDMFKDGSFKDIDTALAPSADALQSIVAALLEKPTQA